MTAKGKWLDTALRARQAQTLEHRHRAHESELAQQRAARQEDAALSQLRALAADWRRSRDIGVLTVHVDGLYQRFHARLQGDATDAKHARAMHQQAHDAALDHLRQSHAIEQALDRTVQRRDRQIAKDALAAERHASSEGWMLHRVSTKGTP